MNVVAILDMAADAFGARAAVSDQHGTLSFAALRGAAMGAAGLLRENEARIAVLDEGGAAAYVALFGAAFAGRAYTALNWRLTGAEQTSLLARVAPALLIAGPRYIEGVTLPPGMRVMSPAEFLQAAAQNAVEATPPEDADGVAVQLFTSGTTGPPKAALLRHGHLMSYILGSVEFGSADESDAALVSVPPYHIAGISAMLSATYAARHSVVLPQFTPEAWVAAARRHAITSAFVVPTMLARIVEYLQTSGETLPHLRSLAYGGGKMPPGVIARAMSLLPKVEFTNAYGLTETSSTVALLGPEDHRAACASDDPVVARRLHSVGRALPAVEICIRDAAGRVLPAGVEGLVFVRGAQVAAQYEGAAPRLDAEGWFETRDRGWMDAEGFLFLDGRADDVIVRGGENISPGEIEDVLARHPAVADAAVVGVPDEQWGEGVAAAVVRKPGAMVNAAELQDWVRDRLRSSRVPQSVRFVDALPVNDMGKVLRRVIRDEFARGE